MQILASNAPLLRSSKCTVLGSDKQKLYILFLSYFTFFQMHPQKRDFEGALIPQDGLKVCLVCIESGCLENKHACKSQILSRSCQNLGADILTPDPPMNQYAVSRPTRRMKHISPAKKQNISRKSPNFSAFGRTPACCRKGGGGLLNEKQQQAVIVVKSH